MNQYYQSLIKELLKDDITKSFDKIESAPILLNILVNYLSV